MQKPMEKTKESELLKELATPKWTVLYNIVSPEAARWIGRGWEFFDEERDAQRCYERHNALGNCASKRPYHINDKEHLGAVHTLMRDEG